VLIIFRSAEPVFFQQLTTILCHLKRLTTTGLFEALHVTFIHSSHSQGFENMSGLHGSILDSYIMVTHFALFASFSAFRTSCLNLGYKIDEEKKTKENEKLSGCHVCGSKKYDEN